MTSLAGTNQSKNKISKQGGLCVASVGLGGEERKKGMANNDDGKFGAMRGHSSACRGQTYGNDCARQTTINQRLGAYNWIWDG